MRFAREEANYAHSKADFVSKFQIALKECYETEYWLELFVKSELVEREIVKELYNQCGTIRRRHEKVLSFFALVTFFVQGY